MCDECGIETGINIDRIIKISHKVKELVGHETDSYILRAGKACDLIRELPKGQAKNNTQN